jgi:hypothetical protein
MEDSPAAGEGKKFVQCCFCNKWRQLPYHVDDEELSDDWQCSKNLWDPESASCDAAQVLFP